MFNSMLSNLFSVLIVIGIGVVIYFLISVKKPKVASDIDSHLLSQATENLTGLAAFGFAMASISLSIGFAIVLAYHPVLTPVFVAMFLSFAIMEFVASTHLSRAWQLGRIGTVGFSLLLMLGGVAISILAGQSLLPIVEELSHQERIKESEEYNAFLVRRKAANQAVQRLAISSRELSQAQVRREELENKTIKLEKQLQVQLDKLANCPKNYYQNCINPTQTQINQIQTRLEQITSQYQAVSMILTQGKDYQGAKELAAKLNNQSFNLSDSVIGVSSGISALSLVLQSEPEVVQAYAFLILAILCECFAIIGFYLWGSSRLERASYCSSLNDNYSVGLSFKNQKWVKEPLKNRSGLFASATELVKASQLEPT